VVAIEIVLVEEEEGLDTLAAFGRVHAEIYREAIHPRVLEREIHANE